jgi:hypothetical protein
MGRGGVQTLSDHRGGKIVIACKCGLRRQYDADQMLSRVGDIDVPELLDRLAAAEGCTKSRQLNLTTYRRECELMLDINAMKWPPVVQT